MNTDEDIIKSYGELIYKPRGIHYVYLRNHSNYNIMDIGDSREDAVSKMLGKLKRIVKEECDFIEYVKRWGA